MHLKSISILDCASKSLLIAGLLSFGLMTSSCRKKIDHELGVHTHVIDNSSGNGGGGSTGSSWTQITSSEIVDVMALQEYNNELYVGGLFENTAGDVEGFAKLDGSDNLIHSGTDGFFGIYGVYDLHVFNNELIIGGNFTYYNLGFYPEDLVRMDATATIFDIPFSESIAHSVRNIMDYNGGLLVTGDFEPTTSNWVTTTNVEFINNNTATGMANLAGDIIYDSEYHDNTLYVCGPEDQLKSWNGSGWEDVNYNDIFWQDEVWDVISYNSELYILGTFTNGVVLKKMNSSGIWENVDVVGKIGGMSYYGGMKVIDNELYLFDSNFTLGSGPSSGLVKFDGTSWDAMGNFSYEAHDVAKFNGNIYVASDYGVFKFE